MDLYRPARALLIALPVAYAISAAPASSPDTTTSAKIDKDLKRCLNKDATTTMDMLECYWKAHKQMDLRMNTVYKTLLSKLSKDQKTLLIDAQKKWLAFRSAESDAAAALDPSAQGSLGTVNRNARGYDLLKERTSALEMYLSELEAAE